MAVDDAIAFFLFLLRLPSEDVSSPPLYSCIHGWTENVPPLKLGLTLYSWNVLLSLYMSLSLSLFFVK